SRFKIDLAKYFFTVTLVSVFFLPKLDIEGISLGLDNILILGFGPLILLYRMKISTNSYLLVLSVWLFLAIISTVSGYALLEVPVSFSDFSELIYLTQPLLFLLCVYPISRRFLYENTYKIFYYGSFVFVFIGFMQYFDPLGIGVLISRMYAKGIHLEFAIDPSFKRVTLTGPGPNDGAVLCSFFLMFNFLMYSLSKRKIHLLLLFLLAACLIFTSSRTIVVGVASSLLLGFFISKRISIFRKLFLLMFIVASFSLPYVSHISEGLVSAWNGENTSLLQRFELWHDALLLFSQSPVLGWGPAKQLHSTLVDGEYFLLLRRYGVLGTLIVLSMIVFPFFLYCCKNKRVFVDNELFLQFSFLMVPIAASTMLTNNFYSAYIPFLPFSLISVLALKFSFSKKQLSQINHSNYELSK
ncbi:O-antigen ligase family protein, partial [Vibrio paracholerae]|uniref:O-antigen ligase family protein n=1 Tax=Vibrio paracholerae TaxID=650003 RepID=UPI0034599701